MKAATGELNLTLITIIAIGAILGFFWMLWPSIQKQIAGTWDSSTGNTSNPTVVTGTGYLEEFETNLF